MRLYLTAVDKFAIATLIALLALVPFVTWHDVMTFMRWIESL